MKEFCGIYNLQNLIKEPTCYKNINNPSTIDVILTKRCKSQAIETVISDFHKMTVTVLKTFYQKKKPIVIKYRNYKHFNENPFRDDLQNVSENNIENMDYEIFKNIFMKFLNKHDPMKQKVVRRNNAPFMNKTSKSFMLRSKLKTNFNKNRSLENEILFKKQRNYCINLLKSERKKILQ